MRIIFWQNCLSPHQLPYIVHLLDDKRVDEVVIVAGEMVSDSRKKWDGNTDVLQQRIGGHKEQCHGHH